MSIELAAAMVFAISAALNFIAAILISRGAMIPRMTRFLRTLIIRSSISSPINRVSPTFLLLISTAPQLWCGDWMLMGIRSIDDDLSTLMAGYVDDNGRKQVRGNSLALSDGEQC